MALLFLNQIKSSSELHLPGDKCLLSGMMGAPGTLLEGAKLSETSTVQDIRAHLLSLLWLVVSDLQSSGKAGGLLLLGQVRTEQSMPKLEALGPQAESLHMYLSAIH